MASMTFGQKKFIPTAPEKGSFPLDHENQCKKLMLYYMRCLRVNNDDNSACRQESKAYLQCRMENNLMAKEDFSKLGFADLEGADAKKKASV
ncbi:cytochrome c oxidase assembly protein COX19 [Ochlerotatus camptorhynchus]|uniref:cytochrome c oxidase assembly protein COX19 n=1 Tax=Ochlerotatus camptorhynchus TaxID=644619 RepID=UPI0031D3FE66